MASATTATRARRTSSAVDHEHDDVELGEVPGHQLARAPRVVAATKHLRDHRGTSTSTGRARPRRLGADRLVGASAWRPGGEPGQHPLRSTTRSPSRSSARERPRRCRGARSSLPARWCGPHGRDDADPAATPSTGQSPAGARVAAPDALSGRDLGVLGADGLAVSSASIISSIIDEPGGGRDRQQAVFDRPGHRGDLDRRFQRQVRQVGRVIHGGNAHNRYLVLHGGPLPRRVSWWTPETLPAGRSQAGDRRLTSTRFGTTS